MFSLNLTFISQAAHESKVTLMILECVCSLSVCASSSFPSKPVGAARVPNTEITLQSCGCRSICVFTSHQTELIQNWTSTGIWPPSLDYHHLHHRLILPCVAYTLKKKKNKAVDSFISLFTFLLSVFFPFALCFDLWQCDL